MALKVGETTAGGFRVVEARPGKPAGPHGQFGAWSPPQPGHYSAVFEVDGRTVLTLTASSEKALLDRTARWLADQSARKDSGWLGERGQTITVRG